MPECPSPCSTSKASQAAARAHRDRRRHGRQACQRAARSMDRDGPVQRQRARPHYGSAWIRAHRDVRHRRRSGRDRGAGAGDAGRLIAALDPRGWSAYSNVHARCRLGIPSSRSCRTWTRAERYWTAVREPLVARGLLHVVDHEDLNQALFRFQFESELLEQGEERRHIGEV